MSDQNKFDSIRKNMNFAEDEPELAQNDPDFMLGISDDEMTNLFKEAVRIENEIKKIKGLPIAGFDEERNEAYLEYPDGRRKYASDK